ncbi:hypothetical protein HK100_012352 [Physocladia obscura]|uniref:Uncharacterized protein n=1 Tax=Physocladia obscura TaxID=109957 RepID=A0AAD5T0H4_9FUNG|nr:hypothetical protein HK100_012352 [Physocladia obscura]
MVESVLVTGANKGIGFEVIKLLSAAFPRATIYLGTRSVERGEEALAKLHAEHLGRHVQVLELDVGSLDSIKRAFNEISLTGKSLDLLINNAGILIPSADPKDAEKVFAVNVLGIKNTIDTFLPILAPTATIINVSSELGAAAQWTLPSELKLILENVEELSWSKLEQILLDYNQPQPQYAWPSPPQTAWSYGISKAILNAYTRLFAAENPNLRVFAVCPGFCATDINGNAGFRSAIAGGFSVVWPILNTGLQSGLFYRDGVSLPYASQKLAENMTPDPNDEFWY